MAAAVENMVVAGTDGGAETSAAPLPTPASAPAAVAPAPAAPPAPPLRKAKTKEGKGTVGQMENMVITRPLR